MTDFATLLQQGNSWLFLPTAIVLGALHGLEPGHSKTMMAAFIIAVRGTLAQAVLLALAATLSHTAIVWAIGLGGLYFGQRWNLATSEPYFQIASALLIIGVALWMMARTFSHRAGHEDADHDHAHAAAGGQHIHIAGGTLQLTLEADGPRAHFVVRALEGPLPPPDELQVVTTRADGSREVFSFLHSAH